MPGAADWSTQVLGRCRHCRAPADSQSDCAYRHCPQPFHSRRFIQCASCSGFLDATCGAKCQEALLSQRCPCIAACQILHSSLPLLLPPQLRHSSSAVEPCPRSHATCVRGLPLPRLTARAHRISPWQDSRASQASTKPNRSAHRQCVRKARSDAFIARPSTG